MNQHTSQFKGIANCANKNRMKSTNRGFKSNQASMKLVLITILLFIQGSIIAGPANPRVPSELKFGDMKLKFTEAARREIQKDVDRLRASPKYFQIKVDRMNLYFPIVERIFKEEKVPDMFKFLAIQESALISDAVSSANAVGFWQFKEPAGKEVGLRIDRNVDERLNIVASSRGAAKYLKRMNFYFKNWVYACLAYNRGPGGAKKYVDQKKFGVKKMTIDKNSFWYVKKFFAHYIAFKDEVGKPHSEGLALIEYEDGANKNLRQVAKDLKADEELVYQYNKWLKRGNIPSEKIYPVVVPFKGKKAIHIAGKASPKKQDEPEVEIYPEIKSESPAARNLILKLNGIKAIVAAAKDNVEELAKKGGIQSHHLTRFNDLDPTDEIEAGEIYYLRSKKSKSSIYYHTVGEGESLRDISQKYGIKLKKLAKKNRMEKTEQLETGRILWLAKKRPKDFPIEYSKEYRKEPAKELVAETAVEEDSTPVTEADEQPTFTLDEIPDEFVSEDVETREQAEVSLDVPKNVTAQYHLVKKGETLYSISRRYGVAVDDLKKWNELTSNDLKPGMNLAILDSRATPVVNPAVKPEPDVMFHEVVSGETLYGIARKYDLSVKDIIEANLIEDGDSLAVGQKLQLQKNDDPEFKERVSNPKYHGVAKGDTMYSIARKYNLSLKELMEMNQKNDTNLSIGERLKVGQ